jgi:hypothetical protein
MLSDRKSVGKHSRPAAEIRRSPDGFVTYVAWAAFVPGMLTDRVCRVSGGRKDDKVSRQGERASSGLFTPRPPRLSTCV